MKVLTRLLAAAFALLLLGYLARNFLVRKALEAGVERQTGFPLTIGAVDFAPFAGRVELRDLRLDNPPGFRERAFLRLPALRVDYDTLSVLRRRPHLRALSVEASEAFLVTDDKGEKNTAKLDAAGGSATPRRPLPYRIDALRVRVGTVTIVDESRGKSARRKLALHVDRTYRNVTASTSLSALVLGSVGAQIGGAAGDLGKGFGEAVKGAGTGASRAAGGLLDVFRGR